MRFIALFILGLLTLISSITLFASDYYLSAEQFNDNDQLIITNQIKNSVKSDNLNFANIESNIQSKDKRGYVLDQYFKSYNSPLYGHGNTFVKACDQYQAPEDCLIVAAIAKHETNLCTYKSSSEMFNCWGFGGGDSYRRRFNSFEESIDIVTKVLAEEYGRKYMIDPELMEKTFCGVEDPLCEGWGDRVKSILLDINEFSKGIYMGDLINLRR